MSSLFALAAGRRTKWVVALVWLVAIFVSFAANLPAKFTDAEENESTSFLPGDAESTKALQITEALQGGEQAAIVIVYRRASGLTAADRRRIAGDVRELNALNLRATSRFGRPIPSRDGKAAIVQATITSDGEAGTILDPVDAVRDRVSDPGGGLEAMGRGPGGSLPTRSWSSKASTARSSRRRSCSCSCC